MLRLSLSLGGFVLVLVLWGQRRGRVRGEKKEEGGKKDGTMDEKRIRGLWVS